MSKGKIRPVDHKLIDRAYEQGAKAFEAGEKPVGAVLAVGGVPLGAGHDRKADIIRHGIMDAIADAGLRDDYQGTTLYTTLSPCQMCAGTIVQFGIRRVVIGESLSYSGCGDFLRDEGVSVAVANDRRCRELVAQFERRSGESIRAKWELSDRHGYRGAWSQQEDKRFMRLALAQAQKSYDEGGLPIGAALVEGGELLGVGHNHRKQLKEPIYHGETHCLSEVGPLDDYSQTTVYTTLSPCMMCAGTIVELGIPRVVIGENRNYTGNIDFLVSRRVQVRVLNHRGCIKLMARLKDERPDDWAADIAGENETSRWRDSPERVLRWLPRIKEQLPPREEDNVRHVRALLEARKEDGHEPLFGHLYGALSILDSKCGALLTYNGLIIAALAILLNEDAGTDGLHWAWALPFLGVVASAASSAILLSVVWVHWSRTRDLTGHPLNHAAELSWVRRRRTMQYRRAWYLSFVAAPVLLGAYLFMQALSRFGLVD